MAEIDRKVLYGKLSGVAYGVLNDAAVFCKKRGNPTVDVAHWLNLALETPNTDVNCLMTHFEMDAEKVARDVTNELNRMARGAVRVNFAPELDEAIERGWVYATLMFGERKVRTGHMIVGFLKTKRLAFVLTGISQEFSKIRVEELSDQFAKIVAKSSEEGSPDEEPAETATVAQPAMGRQEALARFSVDLTEKARKGELDPIVGRDEEIRQVVDILMRRRQNNPILTGEAGVGKTAVVEGFAGRIAAGDVPPMLKDVSVRTLDIGLLQAGASMKGEFEQRLRQVIEEVQQSPKPIILFIDEAHTLIGAGGAAGTGDAANLLKPALARGTLRTIAATTWDEYKRHFEKDPALTRRFQVVKVEEPSEQKAILMMRSVMAPLEKHHRVQILDEAIEAAVRLSHRYIPARQLPDKSVSLIDTASARVAVSQHAVPPEVEDVRRRIEALEAEMQVLARETNIGLDHKGRVGEITEKLAQERQASVELEKRWVQEKLLISKVLDLRAKLRAGGAAVDAKDNAPKTGAAVPAEEILPPEKRDALLAELKTTQVELAKFQGESPLMFPSVDQNAVASVVADWTGIPVGRMVKNEIEQVLKLADFLEQRVIGQRPALETISRRIQTSRARLDNPNRPIGVFMLVGPSGTGKTETALSLAETLYGGEQNMISINMSEFKEAHTVSTLKGSPPGYVGYGEGGILTEAVRRRPYSVVLLDEMEKAHHDVHEIFFQVFDKGWMEDAEGRFIDFKNTIIILTSNAAQDVIIKMCKDPKVMPSADGLERAMRAPLIKIFPDALLNRLVVVPYYPISFEMLQRIIKLNLSRLEKRVAENHKVPFTYEPSVPELIAQRCTELERGARMVDAMITNTILPEVGREFLSRLAGGGAISRVHLGAKDGNFSYAFD